ncbi:hypothetical protein Cgig2_023809 [Carnegiea gigantea]|uniref:DUF4283 domain-containing protein n=1 Tax=Carnegiea gigantea TaxID=171969 RepID=A0A9Q1GMC3_9CARY|nr:hypothetical protein Cgig2_023809 [Carnegiea gigantea]
MIERKLKSNTSQEFTEPSSSNETVLSTPQTAIRQPLVDQLSPIANRGLITTIASPYDSGTSLKFIPASIVNGEKIAKIEIDDVVSVVAYWQNAVLCLVLGAYPPFNVVDGFIRRIWKQYVINKVIMVRKGFFLVRFTDIQHKLTVVQRGIYFFNNKPFEM